MTKVLRESLSRPEHYTTKQYNIPVFTPMYTKRELCIASQHGAIPLTATEEEEEVEGVVIPMGTTAALREYHLYWDPLRKFIEGIAGHREELFFCAELAGQSALMLALGVARCLKNQQGYSFPSEVFFDNNWTISDEGLFLMAKQVVLITKDSAVELETY